MPRFDDYTAKAAVTPKFHHAALRLRAAHAAAEQGRALRGRPRRRRRVVSRRRCIFACARHDLSCLAFLPVIAKRDGADAILSFREAAIATARLDDISCAPPLFGRKNFTHVSSARFPRRFYTVFRSRQEKCLVCFIGIGPMAKLASLFSTSFITRRS